VPIVIAGFTGSLFVLSVNAWMNNPSGFRLGADGRPVDVEPWKALFGNPYLWPEIVHMAGRQR
jgi:cytochrome d ubiquinol oxidase subunit I